VRGRDADVIVVGGGPAGSVTAAALASRGHRILLFDKARFPRHKACSEYVNSGGARLLHELGLGADLAALGAHQLGAMRIHAPGGSNFLADFASVDPLQPAIGLSRYRLDVLLLDRARDNGVMVHDGSRVRDLLIEDRSVAGVEVTIDGVREIVRAPLVVGADGRHGIVSRVLALDTSLRWPRRTGLVAHYRGVTGLERWGEMHVTRQGYAGLAPLEDGLTNVALVAASSAVANREGTLEDYFQTGLEAFPSMAARLAGATRVGGIRGMGSMAHRARRVAGNGFLLVGDAASFLDPFTGDGIHEALQGALLAVPVVDAALRAGDLSARRLTPYRTARRRAFVAKHQVCWLVQGFIANPVLMDYATSRLARRPASAHTLAAVLGDLHPARDALSPRYLARLLQP
jgi:flavin-dependent dehydrogenase